ncbi:M43 family zinc metalloprotease [Chryseobacterium sp. Leaf394]|uniref:M43 family zinc metalloprotease n=1 Tax=Chryseobacterium sp. Leaf394 TaxID=1736361 RepID=UPI000729106C|nr:M43 family zinc metalloprotease [Chryseobacterium sp. Leaf394]KQS94248.1 hypothetical protein ASG21_18610 [Chryseobacterium sp. Leaf394]
MMNNSTISKVVFLFSFIIFATMYGQRVDENSKLEFGKVYTVDQLRDMNGLIRCSSTEYEKYLQTKYPGRMSDAEFEAWLAPLIKNSAAKSQNGDIITIPVVVHVIHSGQAYGTAPNIPDGQVTSQITVMNEDFRRMTGTRGFNNVAVGADTKIQFALAKVDPNGNPTNGIDRVNLCYSAWTMASVNSYVKPKTIWDPTQYMNMWSVNFSDTGLLGYAQFPSNSTLTGLDVNGGLATTDGVVAGYWCFGSADYDDGTFSLADDVDLGRTMTHEVGHFLGLRHLWGDGPCATDYCNDTPFSSNAGNAHYICNPNQDSCPTQPGLDMVRNYMNYTYDLCMNIFTVDQTARMITVMNNSPRRTSLKTSTKDIAIPLFANDGEVKLETQCLGFSSACTATATRNVKISLYNRGTANMTSAVITFGVGTNIVSQNWTGNLAPNRYALVDLVVPATMPTGDMVVTVTTVNGSADQRASNNSFTSYYVGVGPVTAGQGVFTFTLQRDRYGSEITWNLKNSGGTTLQSGGPYTDTPATSPLPAVITQNWTLAPGCYTFTIEDEYGDGIYDTGGFYNLKDALGNTVFQGTQYQDIQTRAVNVVVLSTGEVKLEKFEIYPNPATDVLNVTKVSDKAKYEIHNAAGQLVRAGNISNNQVRVAELVKGTYIITVKDKGISETMKFIKK